MNNPRNSSGNILVVDDEDRLCEMLQLILERDNHNVQTANTADEALELFKQNDVQLIIQDINLKNENGLELMETFQELDDSVRIIMITAYSSWERAVEAMRKGAFDYFRKPFDNEEIRSGVKLAIQSARAENNQSSDDPSIYRKIIGDSEPMKRTRNTISRVSDSDVTVLITGESGTGKELVARNIHFLSPRHGKPFMSINCGALPKNLLESELFGHVEGAFSGANRDKQGLLEIADKGTLFLDEIAEMPEEMQVKLLRVFEEHEFKPVGGVETKRVDLRFVAATNKDLVKAVEEGSFREDLYYRLNVVNIQLPPLRDRGEDIFLLAGHFLEEAQKGSGKNIKGFTSEAREMMTSYSWPGNVRELENAIERSVALTKSDRIEKDHLFQNPSPGSSSPTSISLPEDGLDLEETLSEIEKKYIQKALKRSEGNITDAAELLGTSFRSLRYKINKYDITVEDE